MQEQRRDFKEIVFSNFSYKVISLVIAVTLWLLMLGRKDAVLVKDVSLDYLLKPSHVLVNDVVKIVRIKIAGPRVGLKKFGLSDQSVTLDLDDKAPGQHLVRVPIEGLNIPVGVKVLSVTPSAVKIQIQEIHK